MPNYIEIIKLLENRLNNIKIKSSLSICDINFITTKIKNLKSSLEGKEESEKMNGKIQNVLKNTIRTILSSPTKNKKTYSAKKKFLAESPNIMFINMEHFPSSYTNKYIKINNFNLNNLL